ncbi:MAG: hypothetical protein RL720_9 [Actinomycetota bacterium]
MAHAWKACWVNALGGSNPPSSAIVMFQDILYPQAPVNGGLGFLIRTVAVCPSSKTLLAKCALTEERSLLVNVCLLQQKQPQLHQHLFINDDVQGALKHVGGVKTTPPTKSRTNYLLVRRRRVNMTAIVPAPIARSANTANKSGMFAPVFASATGVDAGVVGVETLGAGIVD